MLNQVPGTWGPVRLTPSIHCHRVWDHLMEYLKHCLHACHGKYMVWGQAHRHWILVPSLTRSGSLRICPCMILLRVSYLNVDNHNCHCVLSCFLFFFWPGWARDSCFVSPSKESTLGFMTPLDGIMVSTLLLSTSVFVILFLLLSSALFFCFNFSS